MTDSLPTAKPLSPPERALGWLITFERILCGVMIVAMTLLVSIEVVCRSFLNFSLLLTEEVTSYLLVGVAFLGMGVALGDRMLFRVEFLFDSLPARMQAILQFFFDILSLVFALILTWQLVRLVMNTFQRDIVAPTILQTPLYLPQSFMAFGAATIVLILFHHIWLDLRLIVGEARGMRLDHG